MRARLHAANGRIGFYREGHARAVRRRADAAAGRRDECVDRAGRGARRTRCTDRVGGDRAVREHQRRSARVPPRAACWSRRVGVHAAGGGSRRPFGVASRSTGRRGAAAGVRRRVDAPDDGARRPRLQRDVRAFFQGNRFLVRASGASTWRRVFRRDRLSICMPASACSVCRSPRRARPNVIVVEGDPVSGSDLQVERRAIRRSRPGGAPQRRAVRGAGPRPERGPARARR